MSNDETEGLRRYAMSDVEVDEYLHEEGAGVLSLASDGDAYGIPVSFGYDGERCYFLLQRQHEESKKMAFAETTRRASLCVMDVSGRDRWRSVIVEGTFEPIRDEQWSDLVATLEDNAWFPNLFSEAEPMQNWLGYELRPSSVTGMKGRALVTG